MVELYRACKNNDMDKVKELLENNSRIDVNYVEPHHNHNKYTPILEAYENRNVEMMELLLKHGADLNIQTEGKNTILILATYFNKENLFKLYLKKAVNILM